MVSIISSHNTADTWKTKGIKRRPGLSSDEPLLFLQKQIYEADIKFDTVLNQQEPHAEIEETP